MPILSQKNVGTAATVVLAITLILLHVGDRTVVKKMSFFGGGHRPYNDFNCSSALRNVFRLRGKRTVKVVKADYDDQRSYQYQQRSCMEFLA
jgi:hypothetical protein